MARFKAVDMSPRFLPVVLEQQLAPGTFEYALHILIDSEFDLSALAAKFKNDETGALFAIDGVKLPSNASKARSGTHAELAHHGYAQ